jgi:hypothetical protein
MTVIVPPLTGAPDRAGLPTPQYNAKDSVDKLDILVRKVMRTAEGLKRDVAACEAILSPGGPSSAQVASASVVKTEEAAMSNVTELPTIVRADNRRVGASVMSYTRGVDQITAHARLWPFWPLQVFSETSGKRCSFFSLTS